MKKNFKFILLLTLSIVTMCSLFNACGDDLDEYNGPDSEGCVTSTVKYTYSELAEYTFSMRDNISKKHTYCNKLGEKRKYVYVVYDREHEENLADLLVAAAEDPGADILITSGLSLKNATVLSIKAEKGGDVELTVKQCPEEEEEY
ncbi:MAG: hypothetical protein IJ916_07620 [Paludibacteraceae bacterium]|nr:hypothetical protein [Paludibacteraceae bacterium]